MMNYWKTGYWDQAVGEIERSLHSMSLLHLVVDSAWKGVFVCLVALSLLVWGLRRSSAASRHFLIVITGSALLLLPILSGVLPRAAFPVLAFETTEQVNPIQAAAMAVSEMQLQMGASTASRMKGSGGSAEDLDAPTARVGPFTSDDQKSQQLLPFKFTSTTQAYWKNLQQWCWSFWLIGFLVSAIVFGHGVWQLVRIRRKATELRGDDWLVALNSLRSELGIRRSVRLFESSRAISPMTWGSLRPVILLPAEARHWSEDRRQTVLTHELAHIKRHDWLAQCVSQLATAAHWFNPLAWMLLRRMHLEREQACDDHVLNSGAAPSDYAEQLVYFAKRFHESQTEVSVGIAMARTSTLEERIMRILDKNQRRQPPNRLCLFVGTAISCLVLFPLSMLDAMEKPLQDAPVASGSEAVQESEELAEAHTQQTLPERAADLWRELAPAASTRLYRETVANLIASQLPDGGASSGDGQGKSLQLPANVLLYFERADSEHCQQLAATIADLQRQGHPIARIDTKLFPEAAKLYRVTSVPQLTVLRGHKEVAHLAGAVSPDTVTQFVVQELKQDGQEPDQTEPEQPEASPYKPLLNALKSLLHRKTEPPVTAAALRLLRLLELQEKAGDVVPPIEALRARQDLLHSLQWLEDRNPEGVRGIQELQDIQRLLTLRGVQFLQNRTPTIGELPAPFENVFIDFGFLFEHFDLVAVMHYPSGKFEVPGPRSRVVREDTLVWMLQAKQDIGGEQLHRLLANPFPNIVFESETAEGITKVGEQEFGLYHDGRWLGQSGPDLDAGDTIRLWSHLGKGGSQALMDAKASRIRFER